MKTGEVEKGDTWDGITATINGQNKTNYTAGQIIGLSCCVNSETPPVGMHIIPNESVPDITNELNNLMMEHSGNFAINSPWYFKNKVKNGGDWDYKHKEPFSADAHPGGFVYDGKWIRKDAPSNIHYGFVGYAAIWAIVPNILLKEAGKAQIAAGTSLPEWKNSSYGDDPVDAMYIKWGMGLSKEWADGATGLSK